MEDLAWAQFALLFMGSALFFLGGARMKSIPLTWRVAWEITQAAGIVVLLFAVLTEGLGCSSGSTTTDEDAIACTAPRC
jgi:hypothetical protein